METEKRLIDANALMKANMYGNTAPITHRKYAEMLIQEARTVDAVPVDEIRVDFERLCLENQEAILNVSICGKPNEVKLPFSKDVAEVVHGRWKSYHEADIGYDEYGVRCSNCGFEVEDHEVKFIMHYCPNCGAKMDGVSDG